MKKYFTLPNIITVVALIFAVYSHLSNRKERRPVWTSSPTILIYNQNQTENNFILLNKDSTEINKNIYTQEIVIWNAGNETIAKSDIRVPLGLVFSKNSNLIDYKILEEKSSVNNNFKLEVFGDSLILNWKYFDPGEGVRFKHIYSSDGKSHPKITGKVLGERITKIVNTRQNALQFFILLVLSICSFIFTKGAYDLFKEYRIKQINSKLGIFITASLIAIFFISCTIYESYVSYLTYNYTYGYPF